MSDKNKTKAELEKDNESLLKKLEDGDNLQLELQEKLKAMEEELAEAKKPPVVPDAMAALGDRLAPPIPPPPVRDAPVPPVVTHNIKEPMEVDIPSHTAEFVMDGDNQAIKKAGSTDVDNEARWAKEKKDMKDFFDMPITVHIHETSDRNADHSFFIGVNGRKWFFQRGKQYTVPRYVVEGLMRAKPVSYTHAPKMEITCDDDYNRYQSSSGLRYGFSIMRDDHPLGDSWYKATMAQTA